MVVEVHSDRGLVLVAVFFLSLGLLGYEVSLTRVFSVMLSYHYVFLVLSTALLGLSVGAVLAYWSGPWRIGSAGLRLAVSAASAGAAALVVLPVATTVAGSDGSARFILVALLPFVFGGYMVAVAFRLLAHRVALLYAADMTGAALGAVGVVWSMDRFGVSASLLLSAGAMGLGAILSAFADRPTRLRNAIPGFGVPVLMTAGFAVFNLPLGSIPVSRDPDKDLARVMNDPSTRAEIVESRWSSFGRTDLVRYPEDPHHMALYVDGAAGTAMFHWNGSIAEPPPGVEMLRHGFVGSVPLHLLRDDQRDNALVIGAGGGRDVLAALLAGVETVTAVEVNPDLVRLVQDYAEFNGGVYTGREDVRVVVEEGRSFLAHEPDLYDLVVLTLPVTKSSRGLRGFALTETYLFTRESIQEYLGHLTPEGVLVIVNHGFAEPVRLLTTTLDALDSRGWSAAEAMRRIYVLGNGTMSVFVVQSQPLEPDLAQALHTIVHAGGYIGGESFIPGVQPSMPGLPLYEDVDGVPVMVNRTLVGLSRGEFTARDLVSASSLDLSPVTDDRPFFYNFRAGVPAEITGLLWVSAAVLIIVLAAPRLVRRRRLPIAPVPRGFLASLAAVFTFAGIGFMVFEVALFQKLILYLGRPTLGGRPGGAVHDKGGARQIADGDVDRVGRDHRVAHPRDPVCR